MRASLSLLLGLALLSRLLASEAADESVAAPADAAMLRRIYDTALTDHTAYARLATLVTRFPGRFAGSANLAGAVKWGRATLEQQGVDRLELQPVMLPHWERGAPESVSLLGAAEEPVGLSAVALGGSVATPDGGLIAPVVELHSLDELKIADVKGKIVFFNRPMRPEDIRPGTAYGGAGDQRNRGPIEAAKVGAVGVLVRSLTHRLDDVPHTGFTASEPEVRRIPAAALSTIAAERLSAALKSAPAARIEMTIHSAWFEPAPSHNVVGELRGSVAPEKIILVGGHLDSWDLAPGAHDDGAGIVQSLAVLRIFQALGYHPRHTIRCAFFVGEENSGNGGLEYARLAAERNEFHVLALESDAGGYEPKGFRLGNTTGTAAARAARWLPLFAPYDLAIIETGPGGADVTPLMAHGVPVGELVPYSQRYFDIHHTREDTLAQVNERELQLGAAALAALVYLVDQHGL